MMRVLRSIRANFAHGSTDDAYATHVSQRCCAVFRRPANTNMGKSHALTSPAQPSGGKCGWGTRGWDFVTSKLGDRPPFAGRRPPLSMPRCAPRQPYLSPSTFDMASGEADAVPLCLGRAKQSAHTRHWH